MEGSLVHWILESAITFGSRRNNKGPRYGVALCVWGVLFLFGAPTEH
jgi:hypothetical protein